MGDRKAEGDKGDAFDWAVLKALQQANATSMEAMEAYLLLAVGPEGVGDHETTRELLERSIDNHERIIDHLELAVDQLDSADVD